MPVGDMINIRGRFWSTHTFKQELDWKDQIVEEFCAELLTIHSGGRTIASLPTITLGTVEKIYEVPGKQMAWDRWGWCQGQIAGMYGANFAAGFLASDICTSVFFYFLMVWRKDKLLQVFEKWKEQKPIKINATVWKTIMIPQNHNADLLFKLIDRNRYGEPSSIF